MPLPEQINAFTLHMGKSFKSLLTEGRTRGSKLKQK